MLKIIIIAIAIIGIIGLAILSYRRIHLLLISILFGKYSLHYYTAFRGYYYRAPLPTSIKDDLYTQLYSFVADPSVPHFATHRAIQFLDVPFSIPFRTLLRRKGKPDYYVAQKVSTGVVEIPGYKDKSHKYDLRVLYFFWDRIFFMGVFEFRDISAEGKKHIIGELHLKYQINENLSGKDYYINGNNDTCILVQDVGFALMLKYFHRGNPQVMLKLMDYVKSRSISDMRLKDSLEQTNINLPL